jgi:SMC interacting uncharacterized protein involved in chromosome segregation
MSIEKQIELITNSSSLGLDIPGLSIDPIIKNIVDKSEEIKNYKSSIEEEIKDLEERGMNIDDAKKEADTKMKEAIELYIKNIKDVVNEQITIIKTHYKNFNDGLERIPDDVKSIITNIALPPAITVPPGAANPIYSINLAKTAKNALTGTLSLMIISFTEVIRAANKILFVLPEPILSLFEKIKLLSDLISTIPI